MTSIWWICTILAFYTANCVNMDQCGGTLTEPHGVIQTPNFPAKYDVPIHCVWIIDASSFGTNVSIVVYLTQQYVLSGLKFAEYMYYSEDYKANTHREYEINEVNATQLTWIQSSSPFLEIEFKMSSLFGTHLRVLDRLLDVYGFNITYEVGPVKQNTCTARKCRFLGDCYAANDYTTYQCACFPGITGIDCGGGPLCQRKNFCQNGGTCKHIGDTAVICLCPKGFRGNKCEIRDADDYYHHDCSSVNCTGRCLSISNDQDVCQCASQKQAAPSKMIEGDRTRYESSLRLANSTQLYVYPATGDPRLTDSVQALLEKHITRFLRNFNITKINDLEVFSKSGTDITFQFFGATSDATKVGEAINRMVERGRLGNFSLVHPHLEFKQEPGLQLQSVMLNHESSVRENQEFIVSCAAQGSPKMTFRWYKDGAFVNVTRSTRNKSERSIWMSLLPMDAKTSSYTALLGIHKANRLDKGVYTCQVTDWGMQQCRSVNVNIKLPPQLRVDPPSATIYRGESLNVRCLSGIDQENETLGYSWTKNGALFQSDPSSEMWEDLYPDGSILRIRNIQKSGEYSCVVSNSVGRVSSQMYITVVDRGAIMLCPEEVAFGVKWRSSAPGPPVLGDCPQDTIGQSKRYCEQKGFGEAVWLTPDFSDCISEHLDRIYDEFVELTFGYQKTNGSAVLQSCLEYAMNRHSRFLPGEAGFLLRLIEEVNEYMQKMGLPSEREASANLMLHILDVIMQNDKALNKQQQVTQLQKLTQSAALNCDAVPSTISSSASSSSSSSMPAESSYKLEQHMMSNVRVHRSVIKALPYSNEFDGDQLFSDRLHVNVPVTGTLLDMIANTSVVFTVVSYKNLTQYLPPMYSSRKSDGSEVDYMPASRIITSSLYMVNKSTDLASSIHQPMSVASVEIIFQHETIPGADYVPVCGFDSKATHNTGLWKTDKCMAEYLKENLTKCVCPVTGSVVVLQAKRIYNESGARTPPQPLFVIISCGCCFVQSCIAFVILLPVLYTRKCCITLLKMQFCTATSTAMAIFILGFLELLPQNWHGLVSSLLAGLLLLGTSTLTGIALIVQSELGPHRGSHLNLSSGLRGAIGLSWLLPLIYTMCTPLVYTIIGEWPPSWWLQTDTLGFVLFAIIEFLFALLFALLCFTLIRKLLYLAKKHNKHNVSLLRRVGLLYRTTILLTLKIATDIFYLIYLNSNEFILGYVFGVFSVLLGIAILFCFVIKAEMELKSDPSEVAKLKLKKNKCTKTSIEDFCSNSINSPISFYTNHDVEKENESVPPTTKIPLTIMSTTKKVVGTPCLPPQCVETFMSCGGVAAGKGNVCDTSFQELESGEVLESYKLRGYQSSSGGGGGNIAVPTGRYCGDMGVSVSVDNEGWQKPHGASGKCFISKDINEFVGVGGLDILQGVSQDSILGIRGNLLNTCPKKGDERKLVTEAVIPPMLQHSQQHSVDKKPKSHEATAAASEKSTTASIVCTTAATQPPPPPPTITITTTEDAAAAAVATGADDDDAIDGMLDRISHDLDYLLNRTTEVPLPRRSSKDGEVISSAQTASSSSNPENDMVPPPPPVPQSSAPPNATTVGGSSVVGFSHGCSFTVHDVIIEESEVE